MLDELVELIVCALCSQKSTHRIGEDRYPAAYVRERLLALDSTHIEYVMDCFAKTTSKIQNVKAYLLTSLFNAPATIHSYYTAEVQHDMGI